MNKSLAFIRFFILAILIFSFNNIYADVSVTFNKVYQITQMNLGLQSQSFSVTTPLTVNTATSGFTFTQLGVTNFQGNYVGGYLTYTDGSGNAHSIPGLISRLVKTGSTVNGYYFVGVVSSADFTATAPNFTGYSYLIVDPFNGSVITDNNTYPSSSNPPATALNNLLGQQSAVPFISASATLNTFSTCLGNASASQSFTLSGSNLTGNIVLTAPTGFELSTATNYTSSLTINQSGGSIAATTIYVRLATSATGSPSGNITCTSTGATQKNIAISGIVNPLPAVPSITSNKGTAFCVGDSLLLTSAINTGNQWYSNGIIINGATTNTLIVKAAGNYTDSVSNQFGCKNASSINITVNPLPTKPIIGWNGTQLSTSSSNVTYQWLLNNTAISGATASTYKPLSVGKYKVQITDNNGCKNLSDSFNIVVTAVNNPVSTPNSHIAKVYPNPATTNVLIVFNQIPLGNLTIQLLNINGQVLEQIDTRKQSTQLPVSNLKPGNYLIKIIGDSYNQAQQLIINK